MAEAQWLVSRRVSIFLTVWVRSPRFDKWTLGRWCGLLIQLILAKSCPPLGSDGRERILHDEFADVREQALYMIGAIDEVRRNV